MTKRRAGVYATLASLVAAGLTGVLVTRDASNAQAPEPQPPEPDFAVFARPATPSDALPPAIAAQNSGVDITGARLAQQAADGTQVYLVPRAKGLLCRVVVTGEVYSIGCPPLPAANQGLNAHVSRLDENALINVVVTVPNGYSEGVIDGTEYRVTNNVLFAQLQSWPSKGSVSGPRGSLKIDFGLQAPPK